MDPPHMAGQKQDDQLEHTYTSYVMIWDVALKTCRRRWTIGRSGERGSGISVKAEQHDDDDDERWVECLWVWIILFEIKKKKIEINLWVCLFVCWFGFPYLHILSFTGKRVIQGQFLAKLGTSCSRHWPPCQCAQNWIYVLQPNGQHYHSRRSLSEARGQIHLPRK